ncbi:MAG: hypothetical protein JW891_17545 [Candidatus Lokiarchaeota archaeon]|nr:hypothetical protein [Candidatus Lokiarchaeota archaeon]
MVSVIHLASGITLFSAVYEQFCEQIEEGKELVGCFVQAIDLFSKNIGQDGVRTIEMSNLKVLIFEKNPILVSFIIEIDDDASLYKKKLDIALHTFLKNYQVQLINAYNTTSLFEGFYEDLNVILEVSDEDILRACPECEHSEHCECIYSMMSRDLKPLN